MKLLKDILGISTLEDKIEEIYQHCVRANAQTHSRLFEQKDLLEQFLHNHTSDKVTTNDDLMNAAGLQRLSKKRDVEERK